MFHLKTPPLHIRHFLWLLPLIFLFVLGCAQRETDIGANAVTGLTENKFATLSGTATHSTDWHPPFSNGLGTSLEVGNAKNLFAFFAIRFDAVTGLPDSVRVDSMEIRLYHASVWPSVRDLQGLQVRIREIPDSVIWTEGTLVPGQFPTRENYPIIDSVVLSANSSDSLASFPVKNPQEMWHKWHADSGKGLIIEPRSDISGGNGGFIEFYSHEESSLIDPNYPPALLIHGAAQVNDSVFSPDTTVLAYPQYDGYLVIDSTDINQPQQHVGRMVITQGMAQRGAIYFPVDTITNQFSRSVSRAILHLYADTLNPLRIQYVGQTMTLNHGYLLDSTWISHPDSLTLNRLLGPESGVTGYGTWNSTSSELVFDVTGIVSTWVTDPSRNDGIQVFSGNELNTLEREVFYGADADSVNKRPKLDIWYTEISH